MTVLQMAVIAIAFTIAGIAKGAIGMGMPPIAIGLMSFAVPLESAMAIMVVPTLFTNVWQAIYGGNFRPLMRRFSIMSVAAMAGILGVGFLLGDLGSPHMNGWVGLLLVLYSLLALTRWVPSVPRRAEWWANPVIGLISGGVTGATGIAAIPFLPYMQSLEMQPDELVQGLGILFVAMTAMLGVSLALHGAYHLATTAGGIAAIAPTMFGVWLGQIARRQIRPTTFRQIFILGMLAIGVHLASSLL